MNGIPEVVEIGSPKCGYCDRKADGPMLSVKGHLLHPDCVIQQLNELLDPDWGIGREPAKIVGYLQLDRYSSNYSSQQPGCPVEEAGLIPEGKDVL